MCSNHALKGFFVLESSYYVNLGWEPRGLGAEQILADHGNSLAECRVVTQKSYATLRRDRPMRSLAKVDELQGNVSVCALEQRDRLLQIIAALRAHTKLVALNLALDTLRALVANELVELLR